MIVKSSETIKSIVIDYQVGQPILQQKITYMELDMAYPSSKLMPAYHYVFKDKNTLQERYNNYQLVDARNKK